MDKLTIKQNAKIILKSNSTMMRNLFLLYIACSMGAFLLSAFITSTYMALTSFCTFGEGLVKTLFTEKSVMFTLINVPVFYLVSLPIFLSLFYRVVYNDFTTKEVFLPFINKNKLWKKIIGLSLAVFCLDVVFQYLIIMFNVFSPTRVNNRYSGPLLMSQPLFNSYVFTLVLCTVLLVINSFLKLSVFYIIAHPEHNIVDAIIESTLKTLKNIFRIIKFHLSFILWGFLVAIVFVIADLLLKFAVNIDISKVNILASFLSYGVMFFIWSYFNISKSLLYKSIFVPEEKKSFRLHRLSNMKSTRLVPSGSNTLHATDAEEEEPARILQKHQKSE